MSTSQDNIQAVQNCHEQNMDIEKEAEQNTNEEIVRQHQKMNRDLT